MPAAADILSLMRRNIEEPLSVGEIAAEPGLGKKALERKCMQAYGVAPQRLYRAIRLRAIRRLLEGSNLSVEETDARGGYQNASSMTRAYRTEFGCTPSELRRALRP